MTNPSAGWFPDPEDLTRQRYWDGTQWTEHAAPATGGIPVTHGGVAPNAGGAVASLTLGILSLVACGFVTGIPAMILGRKATREIDASNGAVGGRGMASAGFITGLISTILSVLSLVFVVLVFAFGSSMEGTFEDTCSATSGTEDC